MFSLRVMGHSGKRFGFGGRRSWAGAVRRTSLVTSATHEHFSNYIDAQLSGLTEGRAYPDLQLDMPKGRGNPVSWHSTWVTGSCGVKEGSRHTSCAVTLKSNSNTKTLALVLKEEVAKSFPEHL